jgi:hypothetical protein
MKDEENGIEKVKAKEDDYYVVAAAETYNFKNARKKASNLIQSVSLAHYDSIEDNDILYYYVDDYFKRLGVHSRFTQFKVGKEGWEDICEDIDYDSFFKLQEADALLAASKGITSVATDGLDESIKQTKEFN